MTSHVETMLRGIDRGLAAGLRGLPELRGKLAVILAWKHVRERRRPLDGAWILPLAEELTVRLPLASVMTWTVASTGHWDRSIIAFVARYVAPETVVLDVGASLGLWSIPLGELARSRGCSVLAFEPDPQNVPWLTANIERSGLSDVVQVHPCALGSQSGEIQLGHREHGGGNAALLREALPGSVEVVVRRLDDVELSGRISFVKLDVEGFELEVLRGGLRTIERDRPVIFGEFSAGWLHDRGEDLPTLLHTFGALGYDAFALEERRSAPWRPRRFTSLRRLDAESAAGTENVLLVPA